jgi:geranylgeranylglycerol-phosphate geranylgeranyltransferase
MRPRPRLRLRLLFELARPFTLIAPSIGFASGAVTAAGAAPPSAWSWTLLLYPAIGALMAAVLNAASNALNQIYDLEIDRINKPGRPLTSGRLRMRDAWVFTGCAYGAALLPGSSRRRAGTSVSGSSSWRLASPSPIQSRR